MKLIVFIVFMIIVITVLSYYDGGENNQYSSR